MADGGTVPDQQDECFCCEGPFLSSQLDDDGMCTMCSEARRSFRLDGIPAGRPCCRKVLSELRRQMERER